MFDIFHVYRKGGPVSDSHESVFVGRRWHSGRDRQSVVRVSWSWSIGLHHIIVRGGHWLEVEGKKAKLWQPNHDYDTRGRRRRIPQRSKPGWSGVRVHLVWAPADSVCLHRYWSQIRTPCGWWHNHRWTVGTHRRIDSKLYSRVVKYSNIISSLVFWNTWSWLKNVVLR